MAKAKDVEQCASTQKKPFTFLLFVLIITVVGKITLKCSHVFLKG